VVADAVAASRPREEGRERGIPQETVVGDDERRPDLVAVIRFPTAEAIRRFLSSPEYRANQPHRDRAFPEVHSYIAADLMA
jgi:uncharacterized protein (DUF1330 family)